MMAAIELDIVYSNGHHDDAFCIRHLRLGCLKQRRLIKCLALVVHVVQNGHTHTPTSVTLCLTVIIHISCVARSCSGQALGRFELRTSFCWGMIYRARCGSLS